MLVGTSGALGGVYMLWGVCDISCEQLMELTLLSRKTSEVGKKVK
jgi:hypothetical protein